MYELIVESVFSAAHNLRDYKGACERLHGHNWRVEVRVTAGKLDTTGMVMDFRDLRAEVERALERLDHSYLNEVPPFDKMNATAENLARFIYTELSGALKKGDVKVKSVRVWESESAGASYYE